ncbi:MAG: hypothetical protein ABIB79_01715 [archaeon]
MFSFKSNNAREEWKSTLQKARGLHRKTEYELVKRGLRGAAITYIAKKDIERNLETYLEEELFFTPLEKVRPFSKFLHKHTIPSQGEDWIVRGVLTRTNKLGGEFEEGYFKNDDVKIGEMLGYPPCCCDFFNYVWKKGYFDPLWESARNTKKPEDNTIEVESNPLINQALRYFGLRITSHIPCSLNCEGTVESGKRWYEVMESLNEDVAVRLKEILSEELIWESFEGVATIENKYLKGTIETYPYKDRKLLILNKK